MNGWMDGWIDGWVDGWMDGRIGIEVVRHNRMIYDLFTHDVVIHLHRGTQVGVRNRTFQTGWVCRGSLHDRPVD